jgi:hypothetical protein
MGWIEIVYKIGATLVTLITVFRLIRSEIKRLCRWLRNKGAGPHSKKSGS